MGARLLVVVVVLVLAGCSAGPVESAGPFPVRPQEIDVMRIDPCRTLTAEQLASRRLDEEDARASRPVVGGAVTADCGWADLQTADFGYGVQMIPQDAIEAVGSPKSTVGEIGGFGTVRITDRETTSPLCEVVVDATDGALMRIQVQAVGVDRNGASPSIERTCAEAERLAADAIATTRSLS
ncbi:DUF3558 family protein [Pseudonocardia spirodelae]|uniref:DUF3558 family protein n=1 Tax=Pseudonocardia spirodelae TaxID=3133431 RepID=A0ABU8T5D1_9PSEU